MRRCGLVCVSAIAFTVIVPQAVASYRDRNCASSGGGFAFGSIFQCEVAGPWHTKITAGAARRLTRKFPTEEFSYRIPLKQTPCIVGQGIAQSAAHSWLHWPGNTGWSYVRVATYGGNTRVG